MRINVRERLEALLSAVKSSKAFYKLAIDVYAERLQHRTEVNEYLTLSIDFISLLEDILMMDKCSSEQKTLLNKQYQKLLLLATTIDDREKKNRKTAA